LRRVFQVKTVTFTRDVHFEIVIKHVIASHGHQQGSSKEKGRVVEGQMQYSAPGATSDNKLKKGTRRKECYHFRRGQL